MHDFCTALYLGLKHPASSLSPWKSLTTGVPAALGRQARAGIVAGKLARLQGCEQGLLGPSTLHLFADVFEMLGDEDTVIYMDREAYPISRWGAERAVVKGSRIIPFSHRDPADLRRSLHNNHDFCKKAVIVADGFCPGCGKPVPLKEYLRISKQFNGTIVLDDTQALGIFGESPETRWPYGKGGGGILRWFGITAPGIILVSSLAKGFGVPLGLVSGSAEFMRQFYAKSKTRVHCSPPSAAAVSAGERTLRVNSKIGDKLRLRLWHAVDYFRRRLKSAGLLTCGGHFPVQTLVPISGTDTTALHENLARIGIHTVLLQKNNGEEGRLVFIITSLHRKPAIDHAVDSLVKTISPYYNKPGGYMKAPKQQTRISWQDRP